MSYYQPFAIYPVDTTPRRRTPGVSIPSPIGPVGHPARHMDAMSRWKFDAAYGKALNERTPEGDYRNKTVSAIKARQVQLETH